jgi:hypothetical protein
LRMAVLLMTGINGSGAAFAPSCAAKPACKEIKRHHDSNRITRQAEQIGAFPCE